MSLRHATLLVAAATLCILAAIAGMLTRGQDAPDNAKPLRQRYDSRLAKAYVDAQCWQCHTVSTLSRELSAEFGPFAAGARTAGPDLAGIGGLYPDSWHAAHLFNPQSVAPGSQMPAQKQLFVLDGRATTPNARGEARPALKYSTQQLLDFLQSLDVPSAFRAPWPRGFKALPEKGSVSEGRQLYARNCTGCHGQAADGKGEAAVFFAKPPANLAAGQLLWRSTRAPLPSYDDLYSTLTNGLPGSGMPSFRHLSERERASLVAYMISFNREAFNAAEPYFDRGVASPPPDFEALAARGKELYASSRYQCVTCHGADGKGDGSQRVELITKFGTPPRDLVNERLRLGDAQGVYAALAFGLGGPMQGYLLDDGSNEADMWALAAYVRSLNRFER